MDPILLRVWQSLSESLRAIQGPPLYHYTVRPEDVVEEPTNPMNVVRTPFLVVGPTDGGARDFKASMRVRDRLVFTVEAYIDVVGMDPIRKAEAMSRIAADVEYALTRDLSRGGLAVRTLIRSPEFGAGFGATNRVYVGHLVEVDLLRPYGETR